MQAYFHRYLPSLIEWGEPKLKVLGDYASGIMEKRARYTDRDGAPQLIRYDREGKEINEIWYNEGYLATVGDCYEMGVVGWRYRNDVPERIPFFFTQLMHILMSEAETGFTCPVTLTLATAFVLEKFGTEEQKKKYLHRLASMDRNTLMQGATFLTEIQGGSDVGATATVAEKQGDRYLLTGEKWFASNCDAGVALTLARTSDLPGTAGLSLFLLPRHLENGKKNRITIRRLKDKLGVRAVASGELILDQAVAELIGTENEGFKAMAEALNISRMCTATGSLAISRRAFLEAAIYTSQRTAFGHRLTEFPMVRQSLLDIMTDIEMGWALASRMMRLFDLIHTHGQESEENHLLLRLLLAMAKCRLSENAVKHARMALELHGGNGYIEDYVTPRLLRDAQVNTVWEGTSNIMALEALKILGKEAQKTNGSKPSLLRELEAVLQSISDPDFREPVILLEQKASELKKQIDWILQQDPLKQNAHAKTLLDRLINLASCVYLLEEAKHQKQTNGSIRLHKISEYAVMRIYQPERYDWGTDSIPALELFDLAVCYAE